MAAKSSTDEEQAMLPNMHSSAELGGDLSDPEMQERCDQFVTPAFILLAWEPIHPDSMNLENFVIKYSYGQGCATTYKTQNLTDISALSGLCTAAYTLKARLYAVVNWKGNLLAIMPKEAAKGVFTTSVNGMALPEGHLKMLETGDVISCCELAQPSCESDIDSILNGGTSVDNDSDGPKEEKLTDPRRFSVDWILDVLAGMMAAACVIIFVVVVLGLVAIAILNLIMPQAFSFSNLVRFFRHNA
ncbi:hypothetical protein DBV05_g10348 [Lasiodiplodia theobromae]|uniref:Uncharacterized protein n=1 Tax=Lasiodiplodia theobromae TaxID=45133 RepID=A0A5N5D066_9PEZI|nr:hypothetical protein DBV05_g10348 [Lasiodiplodia theobromae]